MTTASVSVLKAKLSEYLARVKRGEEVSVTERGRAIARLMPAAKGTEGMDAELAELVKAGIVTVGENRGKLPPRLLRPPRHKDPGGCVLKALLEDRERGR